MPEIGFTEKFVHSVFISDRDVSGKGRESIVYFRKYESVKMMSSAWSERFRCFSLEKRYSGWLIQQLDSLHVLQGKECN